MPTSDASLSERTCHSRRERETRGRSPIMQCSHDQATKTIRVKEGDLMVYMDDFWCFFTSRLYRRTGLRSNNDIPDPAAAFNEILDSIHPRVKFTCDAEEENKIAFLDVLVVKNDDDTLSTELYRKPTNTNIAPNLCHDPAIHTATFKGKLCRISRICSSPSKAKQETEFLLIVYQDNNHNGSTYYKIASTYISPQKRPKETNLFSVLPFHNDNRDNNSNNTPGSNNTATTNNNNNRPNDGIELRPNAKIPFIPGGITHQLKRALHKAGCNAHVTAGFNLQSILCGPNKCKHNPLDGSGIYTLQIPLPPTQERLCR